MARMLGRYQVPGCCPGTRAGRDPGPDCSGGGSMTARYAKRIERRWLDAEMAEHLRADVPLGPCWDLSDCVHGCSGRPSCCERCNFTCHEEWPGYVPVLAAELGSR